MPSSRHGSNLPRGLRAGADPGVRRGRFGRMFPDLPVRDISANAIDVLSCRMRAHSTPLQQIDNACIPAGYTYLAQFVDHDITFDPSSLQQRSEDFDALVNFRTPRLDLDSMYGSGPSDQPFLYEWTNADDRGVKLLVQRRGLRTQHPFDDLQRNGQHRALIGDPRNDEHLIIAQLHLLFIAFHNAVVDHVRCSRGLSGPVLFDEARRIVRWHYQWIIVHDFLRKIVGDDLAGEVTAPGYEPRWFHWEHEPFIPVEFSGAAYRFGHSMVRSGYLMSPRTTGQTVIFLPPKSTRASLRGFGDLPFKFVINWRYFFDLGALPADFPPVFTDLPQAASRIDTHLSTNLFQLPPDVGTDGGTVLARLNLRRGQKLHLPAGPDVACAMGACPLDATQLELKSEAEDLELLERTPLWYYVLCEASALHQGEHLGPVGGGIVAEVLTGLLEGDPDSYVHASPAWTPELHSETPGDFTMPDLVRFAYPEYRPT